MTERERSTAVQPPTRRRAAAESQLTRGAGIGRYVILERIGSGGMGVVYAAYDPELDRRVALKLIRPDASGSAQAENAQRRLMREAQALARLNHPHVVAVHDIGTFGGQVFVAMEFIDGQDLKQWLAAEEQTPASILELLLQAGDGLAAAHQAGLLHRDFKPANVLFGRDGRVRVADFGLARAMESSVDSEVIARPPSEFFDTGDEGNTDDDTEPTLAMGADRSETPMSYLVDRLTRTGRALGTPAFMAPEQFRGKATTAASDQFSFCLTLYQALFKQTAFETDASWDPIRGDPRGVIRPTGKGHGVSGRIERAIMKGLAVDPAERHESMDALLAELRRKSFPALRWVAAVVVLFGTALLFVHLRSAAIPCQDMAGHLDGVWDREQRLRLRTAFAASDRPFAADMAVRVEELLNRYTDDWVAMRTDACQATRVRREQSESLLDLRMSCLDRNLGELDSLVETLAVGGTKAIQNSVQAAGQLRDLEACANTEALTAIQPLPRPEMAAKVEELRQQVAKVRTLNRLLEVDEASAAAAQLEVDLGDMDYAPVLAEAWQVIGQAHRNRGQIEQAGPALLKAASQADVGRDDRLRGQALIDYALLFYGRDSPQARPWMELASGISERLQDQGLLAGWLRADSVLLQDEGHYDRAEKVASRAVAIARQVHGPEHIETANSLFVLALMRQRLGRHEEALEAFEACSKIQRRNFGSSHPAVIQTHHLQAESLNRLTRYEEALELERSVLVGWRQVFGEESVTVASALESLGAFHRRLGQFAQSQAALEKSYEIRQKILEPDASGLADSLSNLAAMHLQQGHIDLAEELFEQAIAQMLRTRESDHPLVELLRVNLGRVYLDQGRIREAGEILQPLPGSFLSRVEGTHRWVVNARLALLVANVRAGHLQAAAELMEQVNEAVPEPASQAPWLRGYLFMAQAELATARGQREQALSWVVQARELFTSQGAAASYDLEMLNRWWQTQNPS